jgi:hypothetical protein
VRDQPAGGDKENPRLPWIAVETAANLDGPLLSLIQIRSHKGRKAAERGEL